MTPAPQTSWASIGASSRSSIWPAYAASWTRAHEALAYSRLAGDGGVIHAHAKRLHEAAIRRAAPGKRVLDIGTGAGHTALAFAPVVASVAAACSLPFGIADLWWQRRRMWLRSQR